MPNRLINSAARSSSLQLADCLTTLFALELMTPSQTLYLLSPWISDVPILTNRFGRYRAVMPESGRAQIGLAEMLALLSDRGAAVRVMCRPHQGGTGDFLRRLPPSIEVRTAETLHAKGLITGHFYLRGSMNFTHFGINVNDEHVELTTDPDQVALALAEAQRLWEAL
jgi:hypothetical protein